MYNFAIHFMKTTKEVFDKEVDEFKEARDSGNNLGISLKTLMSILGHLLKLKIQ